MMELSELQPQRPKHSELGERRGVPVRRIGAEVFKRVSNVERHRTSLRSRRVQQSSSKDPDQLAVQFCAS